MKLSRRESLAWIAGTTLTARASAQNRYPNAPVKLVIPFPAGGQTDVIARLIAHRAESALGQPIVIENRAGANSLIATEYVAKSQPDGYTLLFNVTNLVQNAVLQPNRVSYDPFRDFTPICNCYALTGIFVVPTSGPRTLAEFVQKAKVAKTTTFGTPGHGSSLHFYGELLGQSSGIQSLVHVPYKGEAPLIPDLISGRLDAAFISSFTAVQNEKDGKMRALATSGLRRLNGMPTLPTFEELGVTGVAAESFAGFFAPARTPEAVVRRLNDVLMQAATHKDVRERMISGGLDPAEANTSEQFAALMRKVHAEWTVIRKASSIQLD